MKRPMLLLACVAAATQLGNTDCGQIIKDPGFDLWCGDRLCYWNIERGDAVRVPTWHAGDDGVEMIGDDVAISQATPVDSSDSDCIQFSMLTDVALDAEVHLQFDVFGDGVVDYDQLIPTASWTTVEYKVRLDRPYNGIVFRLVKKGPGHAVLAEIKASTSDHCAGEPIHFPPRINGSWCETADQCLSQLCSGSLFERQCAACTSDTECADGSVCGLDDAIASWLTPFRACLPAASRRLGERCVEDAECATGVCNEGACSTCDATHGCAGGETCTQVSRTIPAPGGAIGAYALPPSECDAGLGHRATGETCLRDDDCAGARCDGPALTICDGDGRSCSTDLDCPVDPQLVHGRCLVAGIAGGTCR
jgi:hypothetical protein